MIRLVKLWCIIAANDGLRQDWFSLSSRLFTKLSMLAFDWLRVPEPGGFILRHVILLLPLKEKKSIPLKAQCQKKGVRIQLICAFVRSFFIPTEKKKCENCLCVCRVCACVCVCGWDGKYYSSVIYNKLYNLWKNMQKVWFPEVINLRGFFFFTWVKAWHFKIDYDGYMCSLRCYLHRISSIIRWNAPSLLQHCGF